jgi:hypothetical protein
VARFDELKTMFRKNKTLLRNLARLEKKVFPYLRKCSPDDVRRYLSFKEREYVLEHTEEFNRDAVERMRKWTLPPHYEHFMRHMDASPYGVPRRKLIRCPPEESCAKPAILRHRDDPPQDGAAEPLVLLPLAPPIVSRRTRKPGAGKDGASAVGQPVKGGLVPALPPPGPISRTPDGNTKPG